MRLRNIRFQGRFYNPATGRPVNVHKGQTVRRGEDIYFYYKSGKREVIPIAEFYSQWVGRMDK